MKVVVPLAGRGMRFASTGVVKPKPLIPVAGRPMIAWALESLSGLVYSQLIFVALTEHEKQYGIRGQLLGLGGPAATVFLLDEVTEGQLCTVLAARECIDSDEDLLVASADTLVVSDLAMDVARRTPDCRGIISASDLPGDQWSFARTDAAGRVVEVAEKVRISDHASTGLYYFTSGREFVALGQEMIRNSEKVRGEYYLIPIYQKYIQRGWRIDLSLARELWDMGNPAALAAFELHLKQTQQYPA